MASLNEIPKKSPFKVPENYFKEVNRKIISAASEMNPEKENISFIHRFRIQLAVAASVAGLVLLSYAGLKLVSNDKYNAQVSEILSVEGNESLINEIEIQTLEDDITSEGISFEISDLNSKEIIDYLLLENIEINEIYEKL